MSRIEKETGLSHGTAARVRKLIESEGDVPSVPSVPSVPAVPNVPDVPTGPDGPNEWYVWYNWYSWYGSGNHETYIQIPPDGLQFYRDVTHFSELFCT